jgi:hypothetical protein
MVGYLRAISALRRSLVPLRPGEVILLHASHAIEGRTDRTRLIAVDGST